MYTTEENQGQQPLVILRALTLVKYSLLDGLVARIKGSVSLFNDTPKVKFRQKVVNLHDYTPNAEHRSALLYNNT